MTTHAEYDSLPGITASAIKAGRVSMRHMRQEMLRVRDGSDATPAMRWGTLAHCIVLEPQLFDVAVTIYDGTKRGNAWEAEKAMAEGMGRIIITSAERDRLAAMRDAANSDRHFRFVRETVSAFEVTETWTDPLYGAAKARVDGLGSDALLEYKTARTIDKHAFMGACERLGYHLQLAWYWHGCGRPAHVWCVAQESEPPYCVGCFEGPFGTLEKAYQEAADIARMYRACEAAQSFPGIYDGPQVYERPAWATGEEWTVDEQEG
jgi:hypothetical protein